MGAKILRQISYLIRLLSVGIPDSKIVPLRGLLDLEEINAVRHKRQQFHKTIREKYHLPSDAFIALSVGRLNSSKGHLFALEALPGLLRHFSKLHWLVVGDGSYKRYASPQTRNTGSCLCTQCVPIHRYNRQNCDLGYPIGDGPGFHRRPV